MADRFVWSGATGSANGTSWADAYTSLSAAQAAPWAATDTIYVRSTHSKNYGAATTLTLPTSAGMRILCVTGADTGTTVGTLTTGAVETTGTGNAYGIIGFAYIHGIRFNANGGTGQALLNIGTTSVDQAITAVDCIFSTNSSSADPAGIAIGSNSASVGTQRLLRFIGCEFNFGHASQCLTIGNAIVEIQESLRSGTANTTLLRGGSGNGVLFASGCDFSGPTNLVNIAYDDTPHVWTFTNCKIPTPTTGTHPGPGGMSIEFHACAPASDSDYTLNYYKQDGSGIVQDDTTVYKTTGGAQSKDEGGTATSYSLKMSPTADAVNYPLYTPWISQFIAGTGSKTIAVEIATTGATLTQQDVWLEIEYMGTASIPTATLAYDAAVSLTVNGYRDVTAAGSARTDLANDGWFGITSEYEYSLSKAVTVNNQGYVRVRVGLAKDQDIYVDPKIRVL